MNLNLSKVEEHSPFTHLIHLLKQFTANSWYCFWRNGRQYHILKHDTLAFLLERQRNPDKYILFADGQTLCAGDIEVAELYGIIMEGLLRNPKKPTAEELKRLLTLPPTNRFTNVAELNKLVEKELLSLEQ